MDSRDVLFITLSVATVAAVGFWVWLLYYLIKIIRSASGLVEDLRDRLRTIDGILQTVKEKVTSTNVQLSLLAQGVKQVLEFIKNRQNKSRSRNTRASADLDD